MKLQINNKDLAFTIDTYQMFPMDIEEQELEYLNEEEQLKEYPGYTEITYDDVDWTYDNEGYVKYLAEKSIELIEGELSDPSDEDNIIDSITYVRSGSPKFYNYTTDFYVAEWDVRTEQLDMYISSELEKFKAYVAEHWQYEWDKAVEEEDDETIVTIKLDFYTRQEYDTEDYEMSMYEVVSEGAYEHTTYTVKPKGE